MARLFCLLALASVPAFAAPQPGERFPSFDARDVRGERTSFDELFEGRPTLVVAITDREAAGPMREWFDAATDALGDVSVISIVSVHVGGWVSSDTARRRARRAVPEQWFSRTLFDSNHRMKTLIGLGGDPNQPWVFALDEQGRVLARVKGPLSPERARVIFGAFE